jgi:hypothetical protein
MADMAQAVVTSAMGIIGVTIGVGLSHWLGTLNRRHQETRENDTRWYEERLRAYVAYYQAVYDAFFRMGEIARKKARLSDEDIESLLQRLENDLGTVHFVGSAEVIEAAEKAYDAVLPQLDANYKSGDFRGDFLDELEEFRDVSRKDLGHPSP